MSEPQPDDPVKPPEREDEDPAAASGAGYGDHAPAPEDRHEDETQGG